MTSANYGYEVLAGVRRCVAAREAGRPDIAAIIQVDGQPDRMDRLPLDELYTGKAVIPRDHRYITRTEYLTVTLGLDPPPIIVHPFRTPTRHRYFTPVRSIRLV